MKAFVLVKHSDGPQGSELRELNDTAVDMFGLNVADLMASIGLYRDAPSLPAALGYDVVGRIDKFRRGPNGFKEGTRIVAMTRFGGYATDALTTKDSMCELPEDFDAASTSALATQYVTGWYAATEMVCIRPGDRVLIHAAGGGVGTAYVAKLRGCIVFGTTGSERKVSHFLKRNDSPPLYGWI